MIKNSQNNYCIGELTCKFPICITSKPIKYKPKIKILGDGRTNYFYNTGKISEDVRLLPEETRLKNHSIDKTNCTVE